MISLRVLRLVLTISILGLSLAWFLAGIPRTLQLRQLSETPGLLVYADDTRSSEFYRTVTSVIETFPMPDSLRMFLLQYSEARTSHIVMRGLHPVITPGEIRDLGNLEIVDFLDLQAGPHADEIASLAGERIPQLRILHLQGALTDSGLAAICRAFPDLEELHLVDARIEGRVEELERGLRKLQGITFTNCELGRGFLASLENRPDVKIARQ